MSNEEVKRTLIIIAVGEFSVGISGNGFIGLVNCMDWIKNKKITSIDLILTSLAISRIFLLYIILFDCFMLVLNPAFYTTNTQIRTITFFWMQTNDALARACSFLCLNMSNEEVKTILMVIAVGEFSVGISGNAFIGLVNCMDWIKNKKITSIDLILTSLAISRICLLCIILFDCFMLVLNPAFYTINTQMRTFVFFWILTTHVSVWFATCLSIFYFLKIANFFHPLFLWMKWRIDRSIPRILLVCLALSVFISLLVTENLNGDFELCANAMCERNLTLIWRVNEAQHISYQAWNNVNLLTLFPFSVSLISFLFLILSLWRHIRQMQLNSRGCRDPSRDAHMGAIKAIISFLLLSISYYLCFLMAISSYLPSENDLAVIISELIALIYPSCHSFILILGNNKLRQKSLKVLYKLGGSSELKPPVNQTFLGINNWYSAVYQVASVLVLQENNTDGRDT
ncbi:LOW QUALITY PROTEIN: taste receptor type 2 member 7-like [Rhynchonycteris naso]